MLIDCATCPVQGEGCPDCVVAFLLDRPPVAVDLDPAERRALSRLATAGLLPPPHPHSHAAQAFAGSDDATESEVARNNRFEQTG